MAIDKKITELPVTAFLTGDEVSVCVRDGTDFQFSIAQLLGFLNGNINTGANITFGTIIPQNNSGKNGDVFFKTDAGSIHQKVNNAWLTTYTPNPAAAASTGIIYGNGTPAAASGNNGDSYVDVDTGIFYQKNAGSWAQVFSMATGPQGARGNSILNGLADPLNSTGLNGDFYLNTTSQTLFGPKASGEWPPGKSIKGASGNSLLSGSVPPANTTGNNGDFYLNTATFNLYGPKANDDWPIPTSLLYNQAQAINITIPQGSPIPFIIDYAANYAEYGNDPTILTEMDAGNSRRRMIFDVPVDKHYAADTLTAIHIYGHDSGNGQTTIDNLVITIKP